MTNLLLTGLIKKSGMTITILNGHCLQTVNQLIQLFITHYPKMSSIPHQTNFSQIVLSRKSTKNFNQFFSIVILVEKILFFPQQSSCHFALAN
jgi:hypothetical protein